MPRDGAEGMFYVCEEKERLGGNVYQRDERKLKSE